MGWGTDDRCVLCVCVSTFVSTICESLCAHMHAHACLCLYFNYKEWVEFYRFSSYRQFTLPQCVRDAVPVFHKEGPNPYICVKWKKVVGILSVTSQWCGVISWSSAKGVELTNTSYTGLTPTLQQLAHSSKHHKLGETELTKISLITKALVH